MGKKVIYTPKAAKPVRPFSQATQAGNTVFIAGTVAIDAQGELIGKGDIRAQTRQVLENIAAVVNAAGGSMRDVVRTTVYLKDFSNYAGMNEVYAKHFTRDFPARSTVQVSALPKGANVEIEVVAHF